MKRRTVVTSLIRLSQVAYLVVVCLVCLLAGLHWLLGPLSSSDGEPRDPSVLHRIGGVGWLAFGIAAGRMAVAARRDSI